MCNPFKKKKQIKQEPPTSFLKPPLHCIYIDEEIDTAVGYKDLEGRFFDKKEEALKSNVKIKETESINKLSRLILKMFGYPSTDNAKDEYWYLNHYAYTTKKHQAQSLAEVIHKDPSILKDYLNENY